MIASPQRNVTVIPAKKDQPIARMTQAPKRRTAGYARVSTDDEEQQSSYAAQVAYYTEYIQANPAWRFVTVYADEGISGTSTKKREQFNAMVDDALAGKLDLIITKSVSRFARNTVDSLQTIRKLKEIGCEVYFQKENIWTFDGKGELLLSIMSSLAQEESRSISENVTWGQRRRMEAGKVSMAYKHFLGYEKGDDGKPKIVPEEAAVVRQIYRLFLEGKTFNAIAKTLMSQGIPSPGGKEKWGVRTIISILENEKYKGHALLQKGFTTDFLTHKTKKNEGELPQFYITDSHPAIISVETFDLVQSEIARRRGMQNRATCEHPFSGKILCGQCGSPCGPKVWHSNSPYRRTIWQCNAKYSRSDRGAKCGTPHVTEEQIKAAFVACFNALISDKEHYIAGFEELLSFIADTSALDREAAALDTERDALAERMRHMIDENARQPQDQAAYNEAYDALQMRSETAQARLLAIEGERAEAAARRARAVRFLETLRAQEALLTEFDESLWCATMESVVVQKDGDLVVRWRDGNETARRNS
jgi:DNA invertase Pin-like site-specific DNA recombinase